MHQQLSYLRASSPLAWQPELPTASAKLSAKQTLHTCMPFCIARPLDSRRSWSHMLPGCFTSCPTAAATAAARGRILGSRFKQGPSSRRSRLLRHASGCSAFGTSQGYDCWLHAHATSCARVVMARICVMASKQSTPMLQMSWLGRTVTSVLVSAESAISGGAYGSEHCGHFVSAHASKAQTLCLQREHCRTYECQYHSSWHSGR